MSDLQVIWQLSGDADLLARLSSVPERDEAHDDVLPALDIHSGPGTYEEAQDESANLHFLLAPDTIPEPTLALCAGPVFGLVDLYPTTAPVLPVSLDFLTALQDDLIACRVHAAQGVVVDGAWWTSPRSELLTMDSGTPLALLNPLTILNLDQPTHSDDGLVFVPAAEPLPAFFRVAWRRGAIFIRDDIRQRIDTAGLKGAAYNLNPWPVG